MSLTPEAQKTRVTAVQHITAPFAATGAECLVQIYGEQLGHKYDLAKTATSIGRDPDNDIVIDNDSVSRRHASVERTAEGQIRLVDHDSTNGTYVNDQLVDAAPLANNDLVRVGDTIFKFLSGSNIERAYHEEIYRMAIRDGLTQIANKRYLNEFLEREFSRARRYGRDLAVMLFDIDLFKQVNDRLGHLAGDYVLKELALIVSGRIRREELLSRYGGEEFVIVLPETDLDGARRFAEMLRRLVESHGFVFESNPIHITISVGVAALTADMQGPNDLIRVADDHMYDAKRAGRNLVAG